ncbi:MAG: molybdopterin-dependent oxidoreductase, partial [Candidatus Omnitrophota bacterium]
RMCLVKAANSPKPVIGCQTLCQDGMVVDASSPEVMELRRSVLEFLLVNHPLDCPVCDQAGECWLQDYYMVYGLYDPKFDEEKVKKKFKATPIGPSVMLDSERCILCSRCVRFTECISKTHELGIFNRGDRSEIGIYPGRELQNPYSGNLVDLCPVGALTDRDFRFRCRVWYLELQDSICPGCSRGCNIQIHVNQDRPHHAAGLRVMRLKPRYHPEVNQWWMCDAGRCGYHFIDQHRLLAPRWRKGSTFKEGGWEAVLNSLALSLADFLKRHSREALGLILSPQMANEDLFSAKEFFGKALRIPHLAFLSPTSPGDSDDFLIQSDKNPNTQGAQAMDLLPIDVQTIRRWVEKEGVKGLYVFGQDLLSLFGETGPEEILDRLELVIFQGSNANRMLEHSHYILPSATYAEKDGTFTNDAGRVQRFWKALEPLGASLPDSEIFARLAEKMGSPVPKREVEEIFAELSKSVAVFRGLSYENLGKAGKMLSE